MMSKPRHYWWSYVKAMIRHYPQLCREWEELKTVSATPNYDEVGHGSGISKPTEQTALALLPRVKQREFDAVREALAETERSENGRHKIDLIRLVYWRRSHTVDGAGQVIGASARTARRWHANFVYLVAEKYGLYERLAPQSQKTGLK